MKRAVFYLGLIFFGLMHPTYPPVVWSESSFTPGDRPVTRADMMRFQLQRDYFFKNSFSKKELQRLVQRAMEQANPKRVGFTAAEANQISKQVVSVSQCFGIDPIVFTALIWRESNFKPKALSERGAVGLTQMTLPAIKEVLDRLNSKSARGVPHLRKLVSKCSPSVFDRLPTELSGDLVAAWKNSVALYPIDALVLGAVLLKLNLASNFKYAHKLEIYRFALEKYNGDPRVKKQFAIDVLTLSRRLTSPLEIAANNSKFLSSIEGL